MDKTQRKNRRKRSIRKKVIGTPEQPRLSVHKSNKNIYVQIIDDMDGKTLCGVSTSAKDFAKDKPAKTKKNLNFGKLLGESIAVKAIEKGISKVVFDRAGYRYHGVIKAIADAARGKGLKF